MKNILLLIILVFAINSLFGQAAKTYVKTLDARTFEAVSYTHLTLPTTPYV